MKKKLLKECRLGKCVSPHETLRILEDEIKGAEITGKKNELLLQLLQVFFHLFSLLERFVKKTEVTY